MKSIITIPALLAAAAHAKAKPQSSSSACSPIELIVARGTTEPGALGVIVGDPLFNDTQQSVPGATAYAVNYPASFDADSVPAGVTDVINHVQTQSAACPGQKFAMVGYSQGAAVMHEALSQINSKYYDQMVALVMYGDPGNKGRTGASKPFPAPLAQRLKENCAAGDPVCTNDGTTAEAHLSYVQPDAGFHTSSAQFIKEQVDTNGSAGPDPSSTPVGTGDLSACGLMSLASLLGRPTSPNSSCPAGATGGTATAAAAGAGTVSGGGAAGTVVGSVGSAAATGTVAGGSVIASATASSGGGSGGSGATASSTSASAPTQSVTQSSAISSRSGGVIGAVVRMVRRML